MNIVTVKINGIEYNLKGEEQDEYLHKVAGYVDKKLKNILDNNPKLSISSASVLSAINIVDDMFKVQEKQEELLEKVRQIDKTCIDYEEQIGALKRQIRHMEEYNTELQFKLKTTSKAQYVDKKEDELEKIKKEMEIIQETAKKYMNENKLLKSENKETKFQLQSAKYKVVDLEHKLLENQIDLAKEKRQNDPILNYDPK
jgi:cell division protein ZapA